MATELENRIPTLRRCVESLWARYNSGDGLHVDELGAMTESMFRLAVHQRTSAAEAVTLLHRAHQVDGLNPRYAYHLGRIALACGRLAEAEAWLTVAVQLCPDSHRIKTHLALLYRAKDRQEHGDPERTPGAYREWARALSASIRSTVDGSRACRWSGMHDLELQAGLLLDVSARTRDNLLPVLAEVRDLAGVREGGVGAFVVLAIEWLVCGYPVETIRELAGGLPPTDPVALGVLSRTCRLFEVGERELPALLADCLRRRELPEILVVLIHQRRLLWRSMTFPELGVFAAARSFLAGEVRPGAAADLVAALNAAIKRLRQPPTPVGPPGGEPAQQRLGVDESLARLAGIEVTLAGLDEAREAMATFVGGPLKSAAGSADTPGALGVVVADHAAMSVALNRLTTTATAGYEDAQHLLGGLGHLSVGELGEDFHDRADTAKVALAELTHPGKIRRLLARIDKIVGAAEVEPGLAEGVSPQATAVLASLENGHSDGPDPVETPVVSTDVADAIDRAHRAVDENFAAAEPTIAAYPSSTAVTALRNLVHGKRAETLYRMGRTTEACEIWHNMLATNGLDLAVLRNLAVAHTCTDAESQATEAWRRYLEGLYLIDVTEGDPRLRATERERTHGVIAISYLPAGLRDESKDEDLSGVLVFLAGRAAVEAAIVHLRLQTLNRLVSYRSPSLALAAGLCPEDLALLPDRVATRFADLVARAERAATDVEHEKQRHIEAVEQAIRFKQRIHHALSTDRTWALGGSAVDVITNLALVDTMRLDADDPLTYRTALSMNLSDPERDLAVRNGLAEHARLIASRRILAEAARQDGATLAARYRSILTAWVNSPIPAEDSEFLDDPQYLYDPRTKATLAAAFAGDLEPSHPDIGAAKLTLRKWLRILPGATGPARHLAGLCRLTGELAQGRHIVGKAAKQAVHATGYLYCVEQWVELGWRLGHRDDLIRPVHELVERMPSDDRAWRLLEETHFGLVRDAIRTRKRPQFTIGQLDNWSGRVADRLGPGFTASVVALRQRLVAEMDHLVRLPDEGVRARFFVDSDGTVTEPEAAKERSREM